NGNTTAKEGIRSARSSLRSGAGWALVFFAGSLRPSHAPAARKKTAQPPTTSSSVGNPVSSAGILNSTPAAATSVSPNTTSTGMAEAASAASRTAKRSTSRITGQISTVSSDSLKIGSSRTTNATGGKSSDHVGGAGSP